MAAEVQSPLQPAVHTAPPSPTSSTSTVLGPRPIHLSASGLWKPSPTLTQNYSLPMPTPAASTAEVPATIPRSTPTLTAPSKTARLPSLTTSTHPQSVLAPTASTSRSILKPGEIHPANRAAASSPTTSSSKSSSSLNCTSKSKLTSKSPPKNKQRSRGKSIREGAFFAFVLLPLSCWYTRGGKRLSRGNGPPPAPGLESGSTKRGIIEWDGEDDEEVLLERERGGKAREYPELRRPVYGRRDSLGQVAGPGGENGVVIARRGSFSAPVPKGVVVHGRSNSYSSAGLRGSNGAGSGADFEMGAGYGMGLARKEVADYGVDRGAAAVDDGFEWVWEGEREMQREAEFERLRLSKAKSRTGSPAPLRRRSEV